MPPFTNYTFAGYPEYITDWLTAAAYSQCLRSLLIDLTMWRARLIFADPQMLAANLQSVLTGLEGEMSRLIKPRSVYPRMTSQGRWKIPPQVSEWNWQQYAIART